MPLNKFVLQVDVDNTIYSQTLGYSFRLKPSYIQSQTEVPALAEACFICCLIFHEWNDEFHNSDIFAAKKSCHALTSVDAIGLVERLNYCLKKSL